MRRNEKVRTEGRAFVTSGPRERLIAEEHRRGESTSIQRERTSLLVVSQESTGRVGNQPSDSTRGSTIL